MSLRPAIYQIERRRVPSNDFCKWPTAPVSGAFVEPRLADLMQDQTSPAERVSPCNAPPEMALGNSLAGITPETRNLLHDER
jgi:hypothetical protein